MGIRGSLEGETMSDLGCQADHGVTGDASSSLRSSSGRLSAEAWQLLIASESLLMIVNDTRKMLQPCFSAIFSENLKATLAELDVRAVDLEDTITALKASAS